MERPAAVFCATLALLLLALGVWLPWYEVRIDTEVGGFLSSTSQVRSKIIGVEESRTTVYIGETKIVTEETRDISVQLSLLLPTMFAIIGAVMAIFGAVLSPRVGVAAASSGAALALLGALLLPLRTPWSDAFYERTTQGAVTVTHAPWLGWYLVCIAGILLIIATAYLLRTPPQRRLTVTAVPPPA